VHLGGEAVGRVGQAYAPRSSCGVIRSLVLPDCRRDGVLRHDRQVGQGLGSSGDGTAKRGREDRAGFKSFDGSVASHVPFVVQPRTCVWVRLLKAGETPAPRLDSGNEFGK
jgi:hypothetical protein